MNFPVNLSVKPRLTVKVTARSAAGRGSPLDLRELEQVLGVMLDALGFAVELVKPVNSAAACDKTSEVAGTGHPAVSLPGLSLLLIDDREMEECNRQAMDLPGPTNILSFPASQISGHDFADLSSVSDDSFAASSAIDGGSLSWRQGGEQLGELVLSIDTLKRESLLYWQDESEHMLFLLAHGLGHLGGAEQLGQGGLDHGTEHDKLSAQAFTAGLSYLQSIRSVPYE